MTGADGRGGHGLGWRIGWTLAGFAPYVAVSAVHLIAKFGGSPALDRTSKALEMPTLAFGAGVAMLLAHRRPRPGVAALLFGGLALSWLGDVLIERLTLGLGLFFAAHAAYITMFELAFHGRRPSRFGLLAIPWFLALLVILLPVAGPMMPLIALYGLILAAMAISSSRGNRITALGGVLFVTSDSLLAIRLFTTRLQSNTGRFAVMLSYLAAQALIVVGMLRAEGQPDRVSRSSRSPVSRSRAVSPSS
jgi:uncharacterized membrane protein YhhN